MIMDNCRAEQDSELFVLESMYADRVKSVAEHNGIIEVNLSFDEDISILLVLPKLYPLSEKLRYKILAPSSLDNLEKEITQKIEDTFNHYEGCPVICQLVSEIHTLVEDFRSDLRQKKAQAGRCEEVVGTQPIANICRQNEKETKFKWLSGGILEDRKSVFQAHICEIHSREEAMAALEELLENSKIARATHNIYTYVVKQPNGIELSDCEDDGESGAGSKLMHVAKMMKMENRMIVVTRWYGGIHLGPDRFRHICNVARDILTKSRE